jgi:hypothetical protein
MAARVAFALPRSLTLAPAVTQVMYINRTVQRLARPILSTVSDDAARLGYEMTSTTCVPVNDALASYIRPGNPRTVGARFRSLVCTNKEARATMFLKPLAPLASFF